ncbi:MAG: hypothetical protein ACLFO2_02755 [Candidatus Woesearchaeota archaeon]
MVIIAKNFNDDMDEYLARIYGRDGRAKKGVETQQPKRPKPKKRKKQAYEEVPAEVSEEEVFVEYDDTRPGSNVFDWLADVFSAKRKDGGVPEDLPENEARVLEEAEHEIEETDERIHELEEKRDSLWTKFLKSMRSSRSSAGGGEGSADDYGGEVSVAGSDEDVKDVLKLVHKWLEELPPAKLNEFKQSEDFRRYKSVLEKYGLIRK